MASIITLNGKGLYTHDGAKFLAQVVQMHALLATMLALRALVLGRDEAMALEGAYGAK